MRAQEYCGRFEKPRSVAKVKRNLDSVQAALKEREERFVHLVFRDSFGY
jgi:structural maintenance of chromosomes protein 6